jgi:hypothetical protein
MGPDGVRMVAIKPICEHIGIDDKRQRTKIEGDPKFSWGLMSSTGADGKKYEMFCISIEQVNGWLFGINANRVSPESKEQPWRSNRRRWCRYYRRHFF